MLHGHDFPFDGFPGQHTGLRSKGILREKKWAAPERLLSLVPPGGDYTEAAFLPQGPLEKALSDVLTLGWWREWHEYADPADD